jgi:hypothetical protein
MNRKKRSTIISLILAFLLSTSQTALSKSSLISQINEISRTYGFCEGQNYSLEYIKKTFPELRIEVLNAQMDFNSVFKSSHENIKKFLKNL